MPPDASSAYRTGLTRRRGFIHLRLHSRRSRREIFDCERNMLVVLAFRQSRESVSTPLFTPDAVVNKEQSIGIIFLLDAAQSGIIRSPIIRLPVAIEEVAFGNI